MPILLYGRTIGFGYVRADDTDLVLGNQAFLSDLSNAPLAFGQSYFAVAGQTDPQAYYRPVVVLSLMLDAQLAGAAPALYHATNVLLHVGAVLLVFALLRALGGSPPVAGIVALVFAVHPAHVQAVAWIVGRNDILMTIFCALSLLALLRHLDRPRGATLAAHLVCFALALFTKETAILLLTLIPLLLGARGVSPVRWLREHVGVGAAYAGIGGVWFLVRSQVLSADAGMTSEPGGGQGVADVVTTVFVNVPQLVVYAGKALFPFRPSIMPGVDWPALALGAAALTIMGWVLLRFLDRRVAALTTAWFFVFLLPVLAISDLPAYEHRLYMPLVGLAVGLTALGEGAWRAGFTSGPGSASLAVVGVVFFGIAFWHAGVFRDPVTFWSSATSGTPYAGIAYVNLGRIQEEAGLLGEAEQSYRNALAVDPETPKANNNLGTILARREELEPARAAFERELAGHPENFEALFNLGQYYEITNRMGRAAELWSQALAVNPSFEPAHEKLMAYYEAQGDPAAAARHRAALRRLRASDGPAEPGPP